MPSKTTTRAAKAATTQEKPTQGFLKSNPAAAPTPRTHNPERYAAFVEAARKAVDDRLEGYFEDFLKDGLPEEKQFLNEVFCLRESAFGSTGVKGHGEHEVPLFSAIQGELDGMHLVPVDSEGMVIEVEKFITEKLASGWKDPVKDYGVPRGTPENRPMESGKTR